MRLILTAARDRRALGELGPAGGPGQPERIGSTGPAPPATIDALADLYAYPQAGNVVPWVRANMITSADGAVALGGRTRMLSGPADRLVFSVLRSLADAILVGAATARTERYTPVRPADIWPQLRTGRWPTPPIAVVTRELDLDPDGPLLAGRPGRAQTIVLTTARAPAARRAAAARNAEVIVAGDDSVTPAAAVAALAERGLTRILAEGGPLLLGQIIGASKLDELCLTYSPLLAGGQDGALAVLTGRDRPAAELNLAHVLEDAGYLLCRYLLRAPLDPEPGAPASAAGA